MVILLFILGMALGIAGCVMLGIPEVCGYFGFALGMIFICFRFSFDSSKAAKQDVYATYDVGGKSETLTLHQRNENLASMVKVKEVLLLDYKYNEPTLVYTGATVGGVTTGGFHVQGDNYSEKISGSGKYRLVFTGKAAKDHFCPIKKIKLTDQLIQEAENSPYVRKFLVGDMLILSHDVEPDEFMSNAARDALKAGDRTTAMSIGQRANLVKHLTKEECEDIKYWLCN